MRNKHVDVEGSTVRFRFQGKSGKRHTIDLNDRCLARIVKRCLDLPGYELFQHIDEDESLRAVDSSDVNDYLRSITEQPFTAKDFRIWAGTVLACLALREFEAFESETQAKKNIVEAIKNVAEKPGNTPAVCRKCYIHPALLECYTAGELLKTLQSAGKQNGKEPHALREEESELMVLLESRLKSA